MEFNVIEWNFQENDHCWIEESDPEEYIDTPECNGCSSVMAPISHIKDNSGQTGLTTSWCPTCGFVKMTRNLPGSWYNSHFSKRWLQKRTSEVLKGQPDLYERILPYIKPGGSVLDVGCGIGNRLLPFRENGFEVYGVEPSETRSRQAAEVLENIETGFAEDYLEKIDRQFDAVYFHNVLQFVEDPFLLLSAAAGRVADNGILYLRTGMFLKDSNFCQFAHLGPVKSHLSLYCLSGLLEKCNLSPVFYSESPFELVLRKNAPAPEATEIMDGAEKVSRDAIRKYAAATLKLNQLKIMRKAKLILGFKSRSALVRATDLKGDLLPVVFRSDSGSLPVMMK